MKIDHETFFIKFLRKFIQRCGLPWMEPTFEKEIDSFSWKQGSRRLSISLRLLLKTSDGATLETSKLNFHEASSLENGLSAFLQLWEWLLKGSDQT